MSGLVGRLGRQGGGAAGVSKRKQAVPCRSLQVGPAPTGMVRSVPLQPPTTCRPSCMCSGLPEPPLDMRITSDTGEELVARWVLHGSATV